MRSVRYRSHSGRLHRPTSCFNRLHRPTSCINRRPCCHSLCHAASISSAIGRQHPPQLLRKPRHAEGANLSDCAAQYQQPASYEQRIHIAPDTCNTKVKNTHARIQPKWLRRCLLRLVLEMCLLDAAAAVVVVVVGRCLLLCLSEEKEEGHGDEEEEG